MKDMEQFRVEFCAVRVSMTLLAYNSDVGRWQVVREWKEPIRDMVRYGR
jgi:hypothetical protein